jgi:hypothetical protein
LSPRSMFARSNADFAGLIFLGLYFPQLIEADGDMLDPHNDL